MILNENINEFDKLEKRIIKKQKRKQRSFFEYIKRIVYLIDAKMFESTYRDEYEKQNIIIDQQAARIIKLERKLKQYEKESLGS